MADSRLADVRDAETTRVVIFGKSGVGKSALGNILLSEKIFASEYKASPVTTDCLMSSTAVGTEKWYIVDTPGFWDPKQDKKLRQELQKCFVYLSPGFHVALFAISASERFNHDDVRVLKLFQKWFGVDIYKYLLIVITKADQLINDSGDVDINSFLETIVDPEMKKVIEKCSYLPVAVSARPTIVGHDELITAVKHIKQHNSNSHYDARKFLKIENVLVKIDAAILQEMLRKEEENYTHRLNELALAHSNNPGILGRKQAELKEEYEKVVTKLKKDENLIREETIRRYNGFFTGAKIGAISLGSSAAIGGAVAGAKVAIPVSTAIGGPVGAVVGAVVGGAVGAVGGALIAGLFNDLEKTTLSALDNQ